MRRELSDSSRGHGWRTPAERDATRRRRAGVADRRARSARSTSSCRRCCSLVLAMPDRRLRRRDQARQPAARSSTAAARAGTGGREFGMLKFRKMRRRRRRAGAHRRRATSASRGSAGSSRGRSSTSCRSSGTSSGRDEPRRPAARGSRASSRLHPPSSRRSSTVRPGVTGLCQLAFAKESRDPRPERPARPLRRPTSCRRRCALDTLYASHAIVRGWTCASSLWTVMRGAPSARRRGQPQIGRLTVRRRRARDLVVQRRLTDDDGSGHRARRGAPALDPRRLEPGGPGGLDTRVVILAGGRGTRLEPVHLGAAEAADADRRTGRSSRSSSTSSTTRDSTTSRSASATSSHLIRAVFDNGAATGTSIITYVHEDEPLGTAGAAPARRRTSTRRSS